LADLHKACFVGPLLYLLGSCVGLLSALFADLFVGVLSALFADLFVGLLSVSELSVWVYLPRHYPDQALLLLCLCGCYWYFFCSAFLNVNSSETAAMFQCCSSVIMCHTDEALSRLPCIVDLVEVVTCVGAVLQGDWGTQFGMLIQFLAEARPDGLADPTIADLALPELQVCFCLAFCTCNSIFTGPFFENLPLSSPLG